MSQVRRAASLLPVRLPAALLALAGGLAAIDISLSGTWTRIVDVADLSGPAGSDLRPSYESSASQIRLSVSNARNKNWTIDVSKTDGQWDDALRLQVRRTSSGSGRGTVNGGLTYQEIGAVPQAFLTGRDALNNIDLQLRLAGVSVAVPPIAYQTTVVYTIIETQ